MKEFQVNNFITLKLEDKKTVLFVAGERFLQCKYLLLNIPIHDTLTFNNAESIDDASKLLDHSLENGKPLKRIDISPEVEFWAHCSNLQVWCEYNYDISLIHSNLAFPLLKRLTDIGDHLAKQVFKEELIKRLIIGYHPVIEFFFEEECIDYLNEEEIWFVIKDIKEKSFKTRDIYLDVKYTLLKKLVEKKDEKALKTLKKHILKSISNLNYDAYFFYEGNYLRYITREDFWNLFGPDGEILELIEKKIKKYYIDDGKRIYKENLDDFEYFKPIEKISTSYGPMVFRFENRKVIEIAVYGNEIEKKNDYRVDISAGIIGKLELKNLPESISKLTKLESLILYDINLHKIPKSIKNLNSLRNLSIWGNPKLKLTESLWNLKLLETLELGANNLKSIPNSIENLKNLKILHLGWNNLSTLPIKSLENLEKLKMVYVANNPLDKTTIDFLKKKGLFMLM